jgi:hypothetical protein
MPGISLIKRKSNCPDWPWVISLMSSVSEYKTDNLYLVLTLRKHEASPPVTLKPA